MRNSSPRIRRLGRTRRRGDGRAAGRESSRRAARGDAVAVAVAVAVGASRRADRGRSTSTCTLSVTPTAAGSAASARLTSTCGRAAAGGVHGIRAGSRLGEVGPGRGSRRSSTRIAATELLHGACGGDVVAPAHPVLDEIGSPDPEEDQEDQARRRLHVTTVGARRRRAPDPSRCVAQVTVVTTVHLARRLRARPEAHAAVIRARRSMSVSPARSSVVSANDRWSRQAPAMCR